MDHLMIYYALFYNLHETQPPARPLVVLLKRTKFHIPGEGEISTSSAAPESFLTKFHLHVTDDYVSTSSVCYIRFTPGPSQRSCRLKFRSVRIWHRRSFINLPFIWVLITLLIGDENLFYSLYL